jgi:hypothetical protein
MTLDREQFEYLDPPADQDVRSSRIPGLPDRPIGPDSGVPSRIEATMPTNPSRQTPGFTSHRRAIPGYGRNRIA